MHMAGNADLTADSHIIALSNKKKGDKVCFTCKLSSWILHGQIVFTVGIPCFQGDGRQIRYFISLGFRPPVSKNSPEEEFWKLKNNDYVRMLHLLVFLFVCFLRLNYRQVLPLSLETLILFPKDLYCYLALQDSQYQLCSSIYFCQVTVYLIHFSLRMFVSRAAMPLPTTWERPWRLCRTATCSVPKMMASARTFRFPACDAPAG